MNNIQFLTQALPKETENRLKIVLNEMFNELMERHKTYEGIPIAPFDYDNNIKNGEAYSKTFLVYFDGNEYENFMQTTIIMSIDVINQTYKLNYTTEAGEPTYVDPGDGWKTPPSSEWDITVKEQFEIISNDFIDFLHKLYTNENTRKIFANSMGWLKVVIDELEELRVESEFKRD